MQKMQKGNKKMAYPYKGKFKVSQIQHSNHRGMDIVGLDSKSLYSITAGTIEAIGWESSNHSVGFGQRVRIKLDGTSDVMYYGHLSKLASLKVGQRVSIGTYLGEEGNTGRSFGSHCHIEYRIGGAGGSKNKYVCDYMGIKNALGTIVPAAGSTSSGGATAQPAQTASGLYVNYQVSPIHNSTYYPNVHDTEDYAGMYGTPIDKIYADIPGNDTITIQVKVEGGKIYDPVTDRNDYAGLDGKKIIGFACKSTVPIRYRAHPVGWAKDKWLGWVDGFNWNDYNNGFAGNNTPIDCIQIDVK